MVYSIPQVGECLDALGSMKFFSSLDCKLGYYYQILMHPDSIEKTSFTTHCGQFEYLQMPFGIVNAPSQFQLVMDLVLSGFKWEHCLDYIDNILVFAKTFSSHIDH